MLDDIRYNRQNPPTNLVAAEIRSAKVKASIRQIESDLRSKPASEFLTVDEYQNWYHRARGALSHLRRENRFLDVWMELERAGNEQHPGQDEFDHELAALLNEIIYKPLYSRDNLPQSRETALARRAVIIEEKKWIESAIVALKRLGLESGTFPTIDSMQEGVVLEPTRAVIRSIDSELGVLGAYIRSVKATTASLVQSKLSDDFKEMNAIKDEIGTPGFVVEWMLSLMLPRKDSLGLSPEDMRKLALAARYIELVKKCAATKKEILQPSS
ncbi:MAG TPA: hypothetical protein VGE35_04355 [Candidatus Paceibacterota bacterium]